MYLAIDDEHLYWAQTTGDELMRAPKVGGLTPPTVVSTDAKDARGIARYGDRVYWLVYHESSFPDWGTRLLSAPASGGPPTVHWSWPARATDLVVANGRAVLITHEFAIGSPDVYASSLELVEPDTTYFTAIPGSNLAGRAHGLIQVEHSLYYVQCDEQCEILELDDRAMFPPHSVVKGPDITGIAGDASTLFWVSGTSLFSAPRTGGVPKLLSTDFAAERLAVDANCVYGDGVARIAKSGGPVSRSGTGGRAQAIDDARVYWTEPGPAGAVFSLAK